MLIDGLAKRLHVDVYFMQFCDCVFTALLDTGACQNILPLKSYNILRDEFCYRGVLQPVNDFNVLVGIFGNEKYPLGSVDLDIGFYEGGNSIRASFIVVDSEFSFEVLFGVDIINQLDGIIDYPNKMFLTNIGDVPTKEKVYDLNPVAYFSVDEVLSKYKDCFYETNPDRPLPLVKSANPMRIHTLGGPIAQRAYRTPLLKQNELKKQLKELLDHPGKLAK